MQPRLTSSGGGKTSDEIVYELAESILSKVPEKLDIDKSLPELFEVLYNDHHLHSIYYCSLSTA